MSLRLRVRYLSVFFALCGIVLLGVIVHTIHAGIQIDRDLETIFEMRALVGEVRAAGFDYVLTREERPRIQMKKGIRAVREQLARIRASPSFKANAAQLGPLVQDAADALQESETFVEELSQEYLAGPAFRQRDRRTAKLFLSRSLVLVGTLDTMEHRLFGAISRQNMYFRAAVAAAFFALLGLFILGLVLLERAVLQPLAQMVATVKAVSEGNLDLRMGRSEADEFGQLARAFDHMLDEIRNMTVSRTTLEAEVQERSRAEAETRSAYRKLQEAQEQMLQMEKLSALGTLVGGLAHEINNPLMGIKAYVDYAIQHSGGGRQREMLLRASSEVDRIGRIVKNMLVFVRPKAPPAPERVDLTKVIRDALALVEAEFAQLDIEVRLVVANEPVLVEGNADNLQQALLNLLLNARDALRGQPPPRTLEIAIGHDDGQRTLTVADNGPGIPDEIRTRIFDPFFTTKVAGQGTGLGLSVTQQLVEACGGTIRLGAPLSKGAMFVIALKQAEKASA